MIYCMIAFCQSVLLKWWWWWWWWWWGFESTSASQPDSVLCDLTSWATNPICSYIHMHSQFLVSWPVFPTCYRLGRLLDGGPQKMNFYESLWQYFVQAGFPSCCAAGSVKALNDGTFPDWGQSLLCSVLCFSSTWSFNTTAKWCGMWRYCWWQIIQGVIGKNMAHAALHVYLWATRENTEHISSAFSSSSTLSAAGQTVYWTNSGCCHWCLLVKPPSPVGAGGGYIFSGRPSVPLSVRACVRLSVIHVVVLCFRDISSICWRIFANLLSLVHLGTQMTWLRFWFKRSKFKVTPSRHRRTALDGSVKCNFF